MCGAINETNTPLTSIHQRAHLRVSNRVMRKSKMSVLITNSRNINGDYHRQVLFHVGCGIPWNVADHPAYGKSMADVGVKYVKRTTIRETFSNAYADLIDTPVQQIYKKRERSCSM